MLAFRFVPQFGPIKGIYFSVFHAVSAFCNGGFDLMGTNEAYSSLVAFEGDVLVNLVIVTLIIVGELALLSGMMWRATNGILSAIYCIVKL